MPYYGNYTKNGTTYDFPHIGLIYKIDSWSKRQDLSIEEQWRWVDLSPLHHEKLTPFARYAEKQLALLPIKIAYWFVKF